MTDIEIWERIENGDKKAFELLYRRYYSPLLNYAISFNYDEELVKDSLQDLFIKIFTNPKKMNALPYVKAYLYRCLINSLKDKKKTAKKTEDFEDELIRYGISDQNLKALFKEGDEDLKKIRRLHSAIDKLSDNQKNALSIRFVQEFTWKEMSLILDISEQSCMNLIGRTIIKLRKLL
ncbi:MAG: RNA polymerase sigma factor [Bacteroidales bacterium]